MQRLADMRPEALRRCLRGASEDDLRDAEQELTIDVEAITAQLERARAEFHDTGQRANPVWYAKAKTAKKLKSLSRLFIQQELKMRNKAQNSLATWEKAFVQVARERLPGETFAEIGAQARVNCSLGEGDR